jgi:hypothetical protein
MGFIPRWIFSFALLAATYNPTPYNFVRWAMETWAVQPSIIVLVGLVLTVIYIVFFTAILRGIGIFGAVLVLAVVGASVWVLYDYKYIDLDNPNETTWIALFALSLVLAVGMYWGIFWRRLTGQIEVDDDNGGA